MQLTHRQLKGMIAGNPGRYEGLGEWRYCRDCREAFYARASEGEPGHSGHRWVAMPALDPENQGRLVALFRDFIRQAFSPERQAELESFARRQGWDMAFEHRAGGGALSTEEVDRWRQVVEAELNRLIEEAKRMIAEDPHA